MILPDMHGQRRVFTMPGCTVTGELNDSAIPAPEFPSAFLPASMLIGILGAVLLIQRTREH